MPEEENQQSEPQESGTEKKRRGRPKGSGKKEEKSNNFIPEVAKFFVLSTGENILDSEPKIVKSETIITDIREYADSAEIKPEEVVIFELGRRVTVKTQITVIPE